MSSKGEKRATIIKLINQQDDTFSKDMIAGLAQSSIPYTENVIKTLVATGKLEKIKEGRQTLFKRVESEDGEVADISDPLNQSNRSGLITNPLSEFPVAERFAYIERFVQMIVERHNPSLFISGISGVGKTHLVLKVLKANGYIAGTDYYYIKGRVTPFGLYETLFRHSDKLIVFDDCDKSFNDPGNHDTFKAVLDSYDKRTVSWFGRSIPKDSDIESRFDFTGNVIFISNREIMELDDAIRTRSLCVDLQMSREEVTKLMRDILPKIELHETLALREEVMSFLELVQERFVSYNLRTLIKAIRIRSMYEDPDVWQNMVTIAAHAE
jgi:hypothetical protein